jgi:DNA-binding NtrC family response regulator
MAAVAPEKSDRSKAPLVLVVADPDGGQELIRRIRNYGVEVLAAAGRQEARQILDGCPEVPIVLTAECLADGDWRDVLGDVADSGGRAAVVVYTGQQRPLNLSFELLDRGAFGLLAEPLDPEQLSWLINTANSRSLLLS